MFRGMVVNDSVRYEYCVHDGLPFIPTADTSKMLCVDTTTDRRHVTRSL